MILRNAHSGEFEVYDIVNNEITTSNSMGAVGLDFQLGGFAVDPPTGSSASMGDSSDVTQLVQMMAGFGDGESGDGVDTIPLGADTSQQTLLTSPTQA
jgi:hypothetical protein